MLQIFNLVLFAGNAAVSFVLALRNGKGWWSAFAGWSMAGFASDSTSLYCG